MNDTTKKISDQYNYLLMQRSPEERLKMGCSMFTAAKKMAEASIKEKSPGILPKEMKKELFLRFYGEEFTVKQIIKILNEVE